MMTAVLQKLREGHWLLVFLMLAILFSVGPRPAAAHGYIVRAIPEDRAVMERAPTRLQYWFSEALEPEFSSLRVRNQRGEVVAEGGVAEGDRALMTVRLPPELTDGAYIVELRPAFASDGHVVAESRVFFVGEEIGGVAGQAADTTAIPLEVVWRSIVLVASMVLFGAFTLYGGVLVPAWGSQKHRAGLLPPRVMQRLSVIVGVALAAAFAGNLLALIQQTMAFFGIGFVRALDPDFWSLVRIGSRFGDIWNFRMVFLGMVGLMFLAALYFRARQPEVVRPFWIASAWMMALVIGTASILSHAAGSLLWPWVAMSVDWIHRLAVGFWAGGLVVLVLVLRPALAPYEGEARRLALLAVMRRFSRMAVAALFVVITTGIYSTSNWIYGTEEVRSTFGTSLVFKLVLVIALVGIGAVHHIALRPQRYARFAALAFRSNRFTGTLHLEAVLAVIVLISAATLASTPLPTPEFLRQEVDAPSATATVSDVTLTMAVSPGGPGINTYDAIIERDGSPANDYGLRIQQVYPARDMRSPWHDLETIDEGLYVTATDDINRSGIWWTLIDLTAPDGTQHRLAFDWAISDDASVIQSLDPNPIHMVALAAVIAAGFWVIYPALVRFGALLNLDASSVTIALGATVATVAALVMGYMYLQETRTRYDETLNPLPEVINVVLPTEESLQRGRGLYEDHCMEWQASQDFRVLRDRLPRTRDEELFLATREGWRSMPACTGELTGTQRWDIVNYVRTFET